MKTINKIRRISDVLLARCVSSRGSTASSPTPKFTTTIHAPSQIRMVLNQNNVVSRPSLTTWVGSGAIYFLIGRCILLLTKYPADIWYVIITFVHALRTVIWIKFFGKMITIIGPGRLYGHLLFAMIINSRWPLLLDTGAATCREICVSGDTTRLFLLATLRYPFMLLAI